MKGIYSTTNCKNCNHACLKFSGLSDDEVELLHQSKREITYQHGELIFKQGTFVSHIVYVRQGVVKLLVEGVNDKNLIVKLIPSDRFIGFPALENDNFYPFTAIALKETALCLIRKETLYELIGRNPRISQQIISWYGNDYHFLYNKFAILGTKNIHGRFAETLLYICNDELKKEDIFNHITRKELAELAGMSVESMLKLLHELKGDNIITVNGKKITIRDYEMLKRLSRIG